MAGRPRPGAFWEAGFGFWAPREDTVLSGECHGFPVALVMERSEHGAINMYEA